MTVGTHPDQAVGGQRGQASGVSRLTGSRAVQGAASQQAPTACSTGKDILVMEKTRQAILIWSHTVAFPSLKTSAVCSFPG